MEQTWFACNKQTLTVNGTSDHGYILGPINVNSQCFKVCNVCFEGCFPLIIFLSCPVPNTPNLPLPILLCDVIYEGSILEQNIV